MQQHYLAVLKRIIYAAGATVVVATVAGLLVFIFDPEEGSSARDVLGVTAAIAGLTTGVLAVAAAIYAQVRGLWPLAPMWLRTVTLIFLVGSIGWSVWGWVS